ncbi:Caspase-2 like protein [Argiope bruennichi]|uniref:Caspase-2 like protein n=2 Tax=Argiope bruennichi TaxID=94029 RepID=A0A8T0FIV6_ARGBR|nr:Caspase-2 like protein [Argiope bruennichi]
MLDDIYNSPSKYDFFIELTTRGPDAFDKFRQVLVDAGYSEEAKFLETNSPNTDLTLNVIARKRLCYKMNSKPFIGHCFIINNVKFESHSYRYGSDVDAEALHVLFRKLGYNVTNERNLTADEMRAYLKKFSQEDWSAVDSCVLFILSHGDNTDNLDIIYGSDSDFVKKIEIYQMFDNFNCESLRYKPKLFFFQACRGDEEDYGKYPNVSADAARIVKIPTMSNMLAVHSSLPNHKSYRDHEKGTWFCQDLIEVFSSDYLTEDLETMLKTVALKLESRLSMKMCKQVLHIDHFGFKAAIFFCMENVADICEIYDPQKLGMP